MSKNWLAERRRDAFYRKAKQEGYRSRAAYKLILIDNKFTIFLPGNSVLDLGAAPGGWSQVAKEFVGKQGLVIGVDMQKISPIDGITFIQGDIESIETLDKINTELLKCDLHVFDSVISDMSPNISGNYSMDHARSVALCEAALGVADKLLANGGNFIVKVFQGDLYDDFFMLVKGKFNTCKAYKSKASRAESSEIYIVGKGFIC